MHQARHLWACGGRSCPCGGRPGLRAVLERGFSALQQQQLGHCHVPMVNRGTVYAHKDTTVISPALKLPGMRTMHFGVRSGVLHVRHASGVTGRHSHCTGPVLGPVAWLREHPATPSEQHQVPRAWAR